MQEIGIRPAAVAGSVCLLALALLSGGSLAAGGELKPCHRPGMEDAVRCGSIDRPLAANAADSRRIRIHFAVAPAMARHKKNDALYLLAGGPGQSAIDLMPYVVKRLARINNRRDIVFVDQRGTGESAPLVCEPEKGESLADSLDPGRQVSRAAACRTRLQTLPHGDLKQYTTTLAMQDLEAVRAALGHDKINLFGVSYGTRAALEYQRLYPARVRRMVLDGIAPPDMALPFSIATDTSAALQSLLDACESDSGCRSRYPQLRGQWQALLASLPARIEAEHPLTGRRESLTVTAAMLAGLVRLPLYSPVLASALPAAITAATQGRWAGLLGLAGAIGGGSGMRLAMGMHYSVICSEDMGAAQTAAGEFAELFVGSYRAICSDWPRGAVDPEFRKVAASAAPVLLFSGGLDPVTPPRHGERVASALGARARHVVVAGSGHGVTGIPCAHDIVSRFFDTQDDDEALRVDTACLAAVPRPAAYVPAVRRGEGGK